MFLEHKLSLGLDHCAIMNIDYNFLERRQNKFLLRIFNLKASGMLLANKMQRLITVFTCSIGAMLVHLDFVPQFNSYFPLKQLFGNIRLGFTVPLVVVQDKKNAISVILANAKSQVTRRYLDTF